MFTHMPDSDIRDIVYNPLKYAVHIVAVCNLGDGRGDRFNVCIMENETGEVLEARFDQHREHAEFFGKLWSDTLNLELHPGGLV